MGRSPTPPNPKPQALNPKKPGAKHSDEAKAAFKQGLGTMVASSDGSAVGFLEGVVGFGWSARRASGVLGSRGPESWL